MSGHGQTAATDDGSDAGSLALAAARAAAAKHATDIVGFDVRGRLPIADAFVICTVRSDRQSSAVAREIEDRLLEAGRKVLRREGDREGSWVLLDFGDLIVHLMRRETRDEYSLERLWKDCPEIDLGSAQDLVADLDGKE